MKRKFNKFLGCGVMLAASLYLAGNAHADTTLQGAVWPGAAVFTNMSTPFTIPTNSPSITFTLTNSNNSNMFDFWSSTDANLTDFLTNNGANGNMVNYTMGSNQMSATPCGGTVPYTANCGINNDVMRFTGTTYLQAGQYYNFTHDDGMYLYIGNSLVINSGAPTSADTSTRQWNGSTGDYAFTVWYDEVNGYPAELNSPDFAVTPEPSSLLLLGTGFLALAFLLFKKRGTRPSGVVMGA